MQYIALLLIAAIAIAAFFQIRTDPRMNRGVVMKTLGWLVVYAVFVAIGAAIAFAGLEGPQTSSRALALTLFLISWILFGGLWLIRLVPRLQEPARWLMHRWGVADWVLLVAMAVSLLASYFANVAG